MDGRGRGRAAAVTAAMAEPVRLRCTPELAKKLGAVLFTPDVAKQIGEFFVIETSRPWENLIVPVVWQLQTSSSLEVMMLRQWQFNAEFSRKIKQLPKPPKELS